MFIRRNGNCINCTIDIESNITSSIKCKKCNWKCSKVRGLPALSLVKWSHSCGPRRIFINLLWICTPASSVARVLSHWNQPRVLVLRKIPECSRRDDRRGNSSKSISPLLSLLPHLLSSCLLFLASHVFLFFLVISSRDPPSVNPSAAPFSTSTCLRFETNPSLDFLIVLFKNWFNKLMDLYLLKNSWKFYFKN